MSFTDNTAGVEAESIKLFGKSAKDLSLAQCASIASITKNPSRYDPRTHEEDIWPAATTFCTRCGSRAILPRNNTMPASAEPIGLSPGNVPVAKRTVTTYFTDKVLTDVSAALSEQYGLDSAETTNLLYNGGLRIYTTVDPDLQAMMENALERGTAASSHQRAGCRQRRPRIR